MAGSTITDGQPVQVSLLGREMVVPAKPTKRQNFFLSCLDIFWQDLHYNQRLIFYESTAGWFTEDGRPGVSGQKGTVWRVAVMEKLKSSLALCLVHYYCWCGRMAKGGEPDNRLFIDCNDAGVEFVEACSDLPISQLAKDGYQMKPFFEQLCQLPEHEGDCLYTSPLLSIQATLFLDGGLALGIAQSHIVADGQSLWNFMVSWGECSRGVPLSLPPLHNRERLAVPDPAPEKATWTLWTEIKEENEEVEETESFVGEKVDAHIQSQRDKGSSTVGDKVSTRMGTPSPISDMCKGSVNNASIGIGAIGQKASNVGTNPLANGDMPSLYVENDASTNGDNTSSRGKDPLTNQNKSSVGTEPSTNRDKDTSVGLNPSTDGGKESSEASLGSEFHPDPLVQCVFDLPSPAVKKLKVEAGEGYTSFEVICAHFWQRVTIAREEARHDPTYFSTLANFRTRMTPPLPLEYFGNAICFGIATSRVSRIWSESLGATASRIHKSIASMREDLLVGFMHWLETHDNRLMSIYSSVPPMKGHNVASSPRFPVYEVDFGWGKPVAVRSVKVPGDGEMVFFGGRPGSIQGDVEICMALPATVLRRLLTDHAFLAKAPCSPFDDEE